MHKVKKQKASLFLYLSTEVHTINYVLDISSTASSVRYKVCDGEPTCQWKMQMIKEKVELLEKL